MFFAILEVGKGAEDGKIYNTQFYNLDAVISVRKIIFVLNQAEFVVFNVCFFFSLFIGDCAYII